MADTATRRTASTGTTARKTAATKRSTAAKKAAETRRELAKTPVDRIAETAERSVLIPVGAALVARDRLVDVVDDLRGSFSTRDKAEKELQLRRRRLEAELKRFERRGTTARTKAERQLKQRRTKVERDIKQRRNRFERTLKTNRTRVERELKTFRRDLGSQATVATKNVEFLTARVENLVQTGLTAGTKAATTVQERLASVA